MIDRCAFREPRRMTMANRDQDDEAGYEGDVSDKAGDRLGGNANPKVEIAPKDVPAAVTPEP
jgi:hypothetical protein